MNQTTIKNPGNAFRQVVNDLPKLIASRPPKGVRFIDLSDDSAEQIVIESSEICHVDVLLVSDFRKRLIGVIDELALAVHQRVPHSWIPTGRWKWICEFDPIKNPDLTWGKFVGVYTPPALLS